MTETLVVASVDVESAVSQGLETLGVDRGEVDVEVLDEGSRGLFGLGGREARVRMTVKVASAAGSAEQQLQETEEAWSGRAREESAGGGDEQVAHDVGLELLSLMGVDDVEIEVHRAQPAVGDGEAPLVLDISGPGTDALIGRRGETLQSLQHIARLIVGKELSGRTHLVVDVEGFKARREQSLMRLANRLAEQAVRTERTVAMEPMQPYERRIVHLALRDHPSVITESVGEGSRRRVTIVPSKG
jgi:spoIIIJ-associated protein